MSRLTRKFVALLMLLWLPLSGASALAATVSMQTPQGACHEAVMPEMQHVDAADHQHHHGDASASQESQDQTASNEQDSSCNACGVCHLACSGYLNAPAMAAPAVRAATPSVAPYAVSFHSVTFTPLLPPPLSRA